MDCTAEIRQWIDNEGSYLSGVDLLRRSTGKLPTQIATYAKRPAITGAIYDELVILLLNQLPTGYEQPAPVERSRQDEPDAVVALRKRGIVLKKEEAAIHGKLKALGLREDAHLYQKELHELAMKMMFEVQPGLDEVYDALRAWENKGILPVPGQVRIVQETVIKMKRRESLKQMISKHRRALKEDDLPADEIKRIEADIEAKLQEQRAIENELEL